MPKAHYHTHEAAKLFKAVLAPEQIESVARQTGFVRRLRVITGTSVFWALTLTLGAHKSEYISDVLRTLNNNEGWSIRYKPFWNRLAKLAFPRFMKTLFEELCRELAIRVLKRDRDGDVSCFSEIYIDDGSSFALADGLRRFFPGRFRKTSPAAVELHAHMSVLKDEMLCVTLAPDKEGERQYLPPATSLPRHSLSLRDRGYIDLEYFEELAKPEAYLICRAKTNLNPTIVKVIAGLPRRLARKWQGKQLQTLRDSKLRRDLDLLVEWPRPDNRTLVLRLCIRYVPEKKSWTWLLNNIPVDLVDADVIGRLYRLRWQIELVFKTWKSYANLHGFQTENRSIAEGFIWASLCASLIKRSLAHWAQLTLRPLIPISTRIAAMAGPQLLPRLMAWARSAFRPSDFDEILRFLTNSALRTHPERDCHSPLATLGLSPHGVNA